VGRCFTGTQSQVLNVRKERYEILTERNIINHVTTKNRAGRDASEGRISKGNVPIGFLCNVMSITNLKNDGCCRPTTYYGFRLSSIKHSLTYEGSGRAGSDQQDPGSLGCEVERMHA
ncbi:hypothetical protein C0993_011121, partial [Termitomyces sp. T159_Od127]